MSDKSMMDSILSDLESKGSEWDETDVRSLIERAFEAGKADQSDPLAGYSNLTDARKNGQPIDWDKLDGLSVRIFNPDISIVRGKMARNKYQPRDKETGWWTYGVHEDVYTLAFIQGWKGLGGWSLWVKGEIPLIRKTADQLEIGHLFTGRKLNGTPGEYLLCTSPGGEETIVLWARDFTWTKLQAEFWEVITDHGPIQNPEVK